MTETITYSSPAPSAWSVALPNVRRDTVSLTEMAEAGVPGSGSFSIDDDAGTAGHSSDGIVGLKTLKFEQDACSVPRMFSGFIAERTYGRGDHTPSTATSRQIDVSLVDLNAKAGFLRITGSDGNRPAETVSVRLAWILASSYVGTLFSASSYNSASSVQMDKNDYRAQTPGDVFADCALAAKGFNWFIFHDPVADADVLWFANSNTSTAYSSTLKISNVAADVDSTTVFAPAQDWKLVRRPDRVVAGVDFLYAKGSEYQTRPATADTYAWRDGVAPTSTVKTAAAARAIARQFLWQNHTEDDRLTVRLRMRAAYVNLVLHGQRIQAKLSNEPAYASYTWFRVMRRTVSQPLNTDNDYDVELELSPQETAEPTPTIIQSSFQYGYADGLNPMALPAPITVGSLLIFVGNQWKFGNPQAPNIDPAAGDGSTIGGTGAWTLLHPIVTTAASGDRSGIAIWSKTATTTANYGNVFSFYSWGALYEVSGASFSGATVVVKDIPGAASDLAVGSLGVAASGKLAIMAVAQYTPDIGAMTFTPLGSWTVDYQYTNVYWSSQRPWWVGHAIGTGIALEADVGASVSYPWCGIAVLLT